MTRQLFGSIGRLLALGCTGYFLIATSAPYEEPQNCRHEAESVTYQVGGDCGASGHIVVQSPANECVIFVQGASALDLPSAGRFDYFEGTERVGLETSPWTLSGMIPVLVTARPSPSDAGGFWVVADAGPDSGGSRSAGIDAGATPVTPSQPQHPPYESRACTHRVEYMGGKISGEKLACQDGSTRTNCTATLNRM